jgi:hypothetical protein
MGGKTHLNDDPPAYAGTEKTDDESGNGLEGDAWIAHRRCSYRYCCVGDEEWQMVHAGTSEDHHHQCIPQSHSLSDVPSACGVDCGGGRSALDIVVSFSQDSMELQLRGL